MQYIFREIQKPQLFQGNMGIKLSLSLFLFYDLKVYFFTNLLNNYNT